MARKLIKGMKAFAPPTSDQTGGYFRRDTVYMTWCYPQHAEAFKTAADMIIKQAEVLQQDSLLFPVLFLYRHCLEVKLKDFVKLGVDCREFTQDSVKKILGGHGLTDLWERTKSMLQNRYPDDDPEELDAAEAIIVNEFDKLPHDSLRYDTDRSFQMYTHEYLPDTIGVDNLGSTMDCLYHYLDRCYSGIHERHAVEMDAAAGEWAND
jgi:hypothetical protein